jgi:CBS domain-containing protein
VRATTVSQIMTTDLVVARPSMPAREAAVRMAERGVSGLPVVDGLGRVVGVISEGDVLPEQRAAHPEDRGARGSTAPSTPPGPVVADVMTMPAVSCSPELTVAGAAELMRRTGLRRVVVVGAGGVLLGVVSEDDLAAALAPAEGARRAQPRQPERHS